MSDTKSLKDIVEEHGVDPLKILLQIADGDAVGLGLMNIKDCIGKVGRARRNRLLPPNLRCRAASEIMQYLYGKRSAVQVSGQNGGKLQADVRVYIPNNNRAKVMKNDDDS